MATVHGAVGQRTTGLGGVPVFEALACDRRLRRLLRRYCAGSYQMLAARGKHDATLWYPADGTVGGRFEVYAVNINYPKPAHGVRLQVRGPTTGKTTVALTPGKLFGQLGAGSYQALPRRLGCSTMAATPTTNLTSNTLGRSPKRSRRRIL